MKLGLNRWILVGVTGIAVAGGAFAYTRFSTASDQVAPPQQVQVAKGNLQLSVTATGSLKPVAAKSADLSFRSSGVVELVSVQVGDTVQKGQAVARLELRPLELAVSQAEIALRTAQISYQGQVAAARPEDVVSAQAALENTRLKLTTMEAQGLSEDVAAGEASLANAQAKVSQLTNPNAADLASAQASVESARASLVSAEQKLNTLKNPLLSDVASAENAVASARAKLDTLRSPLASDIASAQASLASTRASYIDAQVKLDNLKNPPADTVASAQAAVRSAEASLATAQNSLQNLRGQLTTDKRKQLIDAYLALTLARQRLQAARDTKAPDDVLAGREEEVRRLMLVIDSLETEANMPNAGVTANQILSAQASIQNAQANLESQQLKLQKVLSPLATDITSAENAVNSSKASLDSAQARLNQLQNPSSNDLAIAQSSFDAANAKYNQLLNPSADDIRSADLGVVTARANLDTAQARLTQLKSPALPDVAAAAASLRSAEASLEKTRTPYKEIDLATQRSSVTQAETTLSKTVRPGSVLDIARSQLSVDKSQIDLDTAKYNLDQGTLISPINGIVSKVNINPGASQGVGSSTVVMSIIDPSEMQVDVSVDETDISKVDVNQNVLLSEAAGSRPYRGAVIAVSPASTVTSGVTSYTVTIKVPDPKGLKAGMTATANVIYQSKQNVLLVPNRAIKTVNRERQVQVLVDGKAETRTVQVGLADDQRSEITSGLNEGDTVLIEAARGATSAANRLPAGAGAIPGAAIGIGGGGAGNFRPAGR